MKELKAETINDIEKNILKISTKLFLDQGYDNTTIRQIAEASGIGRGHLYYYFKKKEDILLFIYKTILNKIYELISNHHMNDSELLSARALTSFFDVVTYKSFQYNYHSCPVKFRTSY